MASPKLAPIHARERAFFDAQAQARAIITPVDARIVERYRHPGAFHPREFTFRLLGDLTGRRILDVGCGEGQDAIVLAKLGANVTGVDLSVSAIDVARQRFACNGAQGTFIACGIEELDPAITGFDVVVVEALLHHVLHDLENILLSIRARVRPGGLIVMSEPLDLMPGLRRLRLAVGPEVHGTPDERPLRREDVEIMERVFPGLHVRYFRALGRLNRFLLRGGPFWSHTMVNGLAVADAAIGKIPGLRLASSGGVFWWQRP